MAGIRLEFAQFGHFDSFDVIRSPTTMVGLQDHELPSPIATGLTTMFYVDTAIVEGQAYFYKVRVWRDSFYQISDEIRIKDIFYQDVLLMLLASATSYPSSTIQDQSKFKRSVQNNDVRAVNTQLSIDGGMFDFSSTSIVRYLQATIPELGVSDFTLEFFLKINSYTSFYPRVIVIDTQGGVGIGSLQFQIADTGAMRIYMNNGATRQIGYSLSALGTTLKHHCLMRKDGVFYYFVDGVLQSTYDQYQTYDITKTNFRIGGYATQNQVNGYVASVRLTNRSRYNTTGFATPDQKFTDY